MRQLQLVQNATELQFMAPCIFNLNYFSVVYKSSNSNGPPKYIWSAKFISPINPNKKKVQNQYIIDNKGCTSSLFLRAVFLFFAQITLKSDHAPALNNIYGICASICWDHGLVYFLHAGLQALCNISGHPPTPQGSHCQWIPPLWFLVTSEFTWSGFYIHPWQTLAAEWTQEMAM